MRNMHLHLYPRETKGINYKGKNRIVNSGGVTNRICLIAVM